MVPSPKIFMPQLRAARHTPPTQEGPQGLRRGCSRVGGGAARQSGCKFLAKGASAGLWGLPWSLLNRASLSGIRSRIPGYESLWQSMVSGLWQM